MSQLKLDLEDVLFCKYDADNPDIYKEFCKFTKATIERGFKNYSAKGIFELIRWHSGVSAKGSFKVNNNYTPYYARKFENDFPAYKGFFRKRDSKYDF